MTLSSCLLPLFLCVLSLWLGRKFTRQGFWPYVRGLYCLKQGRLAGADHWVGVCLRAPELSPRRRARAHYLRGLVCLKKGHKNRAAQEFGWANGDLLHEFWPNLMLGLTLIELGEAQEAVLPLIRATRAQGSDARAWFGLGWAYARLRRLEDSYFALTQCLRHDPAHRRGTELLAEITLQMGRYEESLTLLNQLQQPHPRLWMGQKLLHWSRHQEALFWLQRQLEIQDVHPTRTLLATALREQGLLEDSLQQYNLVLSQRLCWQALWGRALTYLQTLERCNAGEQQQRLELIRRDIAWADELSGGGCRDLAVERAKISRELLPVTTKTYVN